MRTTRGTCGYVYDAEELDQQLEFTLEYVIDPGEPMVMYYRDGSGYPGSPAYAEIIKATCTHINEADSDRKPTAREAEDLGNWFLEQINSRDELRERVEAHCFENDAARYDAA